MKISAQRSPQGFTLSFNDTHVTLSANDIKQLLLEVLKVMGSGQQTVSAESVFDRIVEQLKTANDVGMQRLIVSAEEDHILIMLKSGEDDEDFTTRFYANMSERMQTMFKEDLEFKFSEGVPHPKLAEAMDAITVLIGRLQNEGALTFSTEETVS